VGSTVYRPVEVSYDHWAAVKMNPHHWYSSSTHSDKRLVFQPGTSHLDAKLEPLPDSSCSDEDDWIKPNSVLRGNITHLAAQGVDLPRSGLTTHEINVTKGEGTSSSMYLEPGDGRLSEQGHGAAVSISRAELPRSLYYHVMVNKVV